MDDKAKLAEIMKVMNHFLEGGEVEFAGKTTYNSEWTKCSNPGWNWVDFDYRIVPTQPLDIPWDIINPKWKWVAMDEDKNIYLYTTEPTKMDYQWIIVQGATCDLNNCLVIKPTNIPWDQSLVKRPESK
jgi:hypothetical protein